MDAAGLERKRDGRDRGARARTGRSPDARAALAAVGGLELAALAGAVLEAARRAAPRRPRRLRDVGSPRSPPSRIEPGAGEALIASHRSAEPGHDLVLAELGLEPLLDLRLRLGEASGALLALPLIAAAGALHREMATFAEGRRHPRSRDRPLARPRADVPDDPAGPAAARRRRSAPRRRWFPARRRAGGGASRARSATWSSRRSARPSPRSSRWSRSSCSPARCTRTGSRTAPTRWAAGQPGTAAGDHARLVDRRPSARSPSCLFALLTAALTGLDRDDALRTLIAAAATARWAALLHATLAGPARPDGLGAGSPSRGSPSRVATVIAAAVAIALFGVVGLAALLAAAFAAGLVTAWANSRLGGRTGDTLGAAVALAEAVVAVVLLGFTAN